MKQTVRENIRAPCSLHDMRITAFEVAGDAVIMRTHSGMVKTTLPYGQPDGHVEFHDVRWDFSYAYLLDFTGNAGPFTGEKIFLKDFIQRFNPLAFSVIDETYGFNMTKYSGHLIAERCFECMIEIYHEGDMFFVDETKYEGMKEVILSHDSEAMLYLVPAEVAAHLDQYCLDFASNWVWHGPENGRFLQDFGNGQLGAIFGAPDFIDYLNKWVFPDQPSAFVKGLGCCNYEIPAQYKDYPQFNF